MKYPTNMTMPSYQHTIGNKEDPKEGPVTNSTLLSSMMPTMLYHRRVVAAGVGLLLVAAVAAAVVVLQQPGRSPYDQSFGSLRAAVVDVPGWLVNSDSRITYRNDAPPEIFSTLTTENLCWYGPPGTVFNGLTGVYSSCQDLPFDTCYQLGEEAVYCWTEAYYLEKYEINCPCTPTGGTWKPVDAQ